MLSLIVIGVGSFFALIFHIGTKEKNLDNCPNDPAAQKRKSDLFQPMSWSDWLKQVQFYQVRKCE